MSKEMKCPITGKVAGSQRNHTINKDWWPDQVNLKILQQHSDRVNPLDADFDYAESFKQLDYFALKEDLKKMMTDSQSWWPADYGHYGPFIIRMAWHSAGTYRAGDGRGGAGTGSQRFAPLNSWPDNANLDKARRLLWPIKKKYGQRISWADLMILAGNCALESMGFKTLGFAGGRVDVWEPEEDIYWGKEKEWLADERHDDNRELEKPLAAVQMGLIYVNPEGPNGVPDAIASAKDIRATFSRMGMNDEETVALIAGGHTFGKAHGAAKDEHLGPAPEAAPIENMGLGWENSFKSGMGDHTITSGIEGAWTATPTAWDNSFFENLFKYDWNLVKSPAGAWQWIPSEVLEEDLVVNAHDASKKSAPMMLTSDLALRMDPQYKAISLNFLNNPEAFEESFAKAWFKLTHRDLGPRHKYLGPEVPDCQFAWQDPLPEKGHSLINKHNESELKLKILQSNLKIEEMVWAAWASASTYRSTDYKGGTNGGRIALEPQINWQVNEPEKLIKILTIYKEIQKEFNHAHITEHFISLSDLIVLGGCVGIEQAAQNANYTVEVPFRSGRVDANQNETDVNSMSVLEPIVDGFRNYTKEGFRVNAVESLIDKSQQLGLTAPQMTVLIGGFRALGINYLNSKMGVLTNKPGILTNDFFVNLLDMNTMWRPMNEGKTLFEGINRSNGEKLWIASDVDLVFGSNSQLRAYAEVYASDDGVLKFLDDFINTWCQLMNANLPTETLHF